jgi:malic enzyme
MSALGGVRQSGAPSCGAGCIESAYLFPGIGLGTLVARATRLREDMLLAAAEALAATVTDGAGPDMRCGQ